ncbi:MAG: SAM-dependent DNA methyltransferase [Candidatus Tectomicrobia bacterium]|uniref:SAM-dependent DNA methyltransferase n=1 Tax=Tectimicrobiota bacterium TaxID=2528274 RepID=A0A932GQ52_UNCTE|nr:SAM-dependent DNA methyltransferase [Candidatus Tectomicrobia bacterium]
MTSSLENRKRLGQVLTPEIVARGLVGWVVRRENDRLLDPSCGDGRFVACHRASVGVEVHKDAAAVARTRAPWALIHEAEFFAWASETRERFEAAAGNPPFIRYQHFNGVVRERALKAAARLGARFNGLASSWAPFLVVTAGLLKPGGRMAFVVPAEIGHAPYAIPTLTALCDHFDEVQVIAVREKLFPELSEDAWLLYARGFGGNTNSIELSVVGRFVPIGQPPRRTKRVTLGAWREAGYRLRKFLLSADSLSTYQDLSTRREVVRFADVASVGIGYVSGANDFFHLRPSEAKSLGFPDEVLRVTIRKGEQLPSVRVDGNVVRKWLRRDEPVLLIDLKGVNELTPGIKRYLDGPAGREVRKGYKCRNRDPWYAVPDVRVPDAFLSYMSGVRPALVRNDAGCVCTNSVHAVTLKLGCSITRLQRAWSNPLVDLSCELEGHPLGGGLLKLEPREAANVRLPLGNLRLKSSEATALRDGIDDMRRWRHYA